MPFTVVKYIATPHRIRYRLNKPEVGAGSVTVPIAGGPTPDLLTDSENGPLKERLQAIAAGVYVDGDAVFAAFWSNGQLSLDAPASSSAIPPGYGDSPGIVFDVDAFGKPLLLLGAGGRINTFLDLVFVNSLVG